MKKSERVKVIIKRLEEIYPETHIPLDHQNDFTLLIAVVLSAQSTDKKVNELTKELFRVANSAEEMYRLGEEKIYSYIKQLGLAKTKAKNIYNLSRIVINKYNNIVPNSFKSLESLPGVGHKTASVVMSQAFGIPSFPVDTHIHRLSQRWGLSSGKSVIQTEKDLKKIFPKSLWNKLHLQIIFYGREYCSARGCNGTICKLCKELYPSRKKPVICLKA
ncbi:endonuclease III [Prochlorococcus marinus]|uniref:Endonuclease III n=1 Tax=Prochlorococcus marinus XMU1408 TaxID=2213228 RepID=A0A318R552_PROMR|nr:endonuclease III [Prochlorococcus marinus]MBW3041807.1 endonuclease III [Prochlorococcus marinus str. XMU1408]PYE02948.1 endonuclease III [Prochlorococcus marinus XMU1408]